MAILGQGTCALTATQPGDDATRTADPVSQGFLVSGLPQTITVAPVGPTPLTTTQLTPKRRLVPASPLTTTPATENICGVDGFLIKLLRPGTCSVFS